VVSAADGSIAALLGASPGASTAVSIMVTLMSRCFPQYIEKPEWQKKLSQMIPSYGQSLSEDPVLMETLRTQTSHALKLRTEVPVV
jgi:malate dehydrogenase (quinone)